MSSFIDPRASNVWSEEVYGGHYDTGGNYHYYGTQTGHHVVRKNPRNIYTEQLAAMPVKRATCEFCAKHEKGDVLYECNPWDGGLSYDYIENIQYCPICGSMLNG